MASLKSLIWRGSFYGDLRIWIMRGEIIEDVKRFWLQFFNVSVQLNVQLEELLSNLVEICKILHVKSFMIVNLYLHRVQSHFAPDLHSTSGSKLCVHRIQSMTAFVFTFRYPPLVTMIWLILRRCSSSQFTMNTDCVGGEGSRGVIDIDQQRPFNQTEKP